MAKPLEGIYFTKKAGQHEISTNQTAERMFATVRTALDNLGAVYYTEDFTIKVLGQESLEKVARAGGNFNGSSEYQQKEAQIA